ncbi:MAG TPA: antitoxin MazE family protein [Propylenella sp.]
MSRLAKHIEEELLRENPALRAKGLRPEVRWVPDTTSPEFKSEIERELELIRQSPEEQEILDWIERVADWPKD